VLLRRTWSGAWHPCGRGAGGRERASASFRRVTLAEVVEQLEALDPGATIYAARPWRAKARAVVAVEPDDGSVPREAAGLDYFLEVDVALEAATVSNARTRIERVLHYAANDAFLLDP
jgi:hypothetical protein